LTEDNAAEGLRDTRNCNDESNDVYFAAGRGRTRKIAMLSSPMSNLFSKPALKAPPVRTHQFLSFTGRHTCATLYFYSRLWSFLDAMNALL